MTPYNLILKHRKPLGRAWVIVLILISGGIVLAEDVSSPPPSLPDSFDPVLREQLEAMDVRLADVEDFEATFTKLKFTPLLKKPLTSRGVVRATRDVVLWDTIEPRISHTYIADDEVVLYDPRRKRAEVYPLTGEMAGFGASPLSSVRTLVEQFEVELDSRETPEGIIALRLIPRSIQMREQIDSLIFIVNPAKAHIVALLMLQPSGERTEYLFDAVTLDPGLDPDALTLNLPEDVEVVRPYGGGP